MTLHACDEQDEAAERRDASRHWRSLARFRRHQGGATAIEFGLVAVPFFTLVFAIVEIVLLFWTSQELEVALTQTSRQLLTGQAKSRYSSTNAAENTQKFKQDICNNATLLVADCMSKLTVDVRSYASFAQAQTGTAGSNPVQGGALNTTGFGYTQPQGGQIVVVRAVLMYPVLFGSWSSALVSITGTDNYALVSSTAFRTEPFL